MSLLDIYIWDVEHGLSVTIFTPFVDLLGVTRRRIIQYDLGNNSATPFSPINYLVENGFKEIDYLFVSHPHQDHLSDAPNLAEHRRQGNLKLHAFHRNKTSPILEPQKALTDHTAAIITHYNFANEYTQSIDPNSSLNIFNSAHNGGIWLQANQLDHGVTGNPNDASIVLSITYGSTQIILPGDLEGAGFELLKLINKLPLPLAGVTKILVAPHHGRRSADPSGLLEYYKPDLVLASAKRGDVYTDQLYSQCQNVGGHLVCQTTGVATKQKFCATKGMAIHVSIPNEGPARVTREDHHHQLIT